MDSISVLAMQSSSLSVDESAIAIAFIGMLTLRQGYRSVTDDHGVHRLITEDTRVTALMNRNVKVYSW